MSEFHENSYKVLSRVIGIHEDLHKDRYPSLSILAERFGVSTKTIQRDLSFMKRMLNLPIDHCPHYRGYRYAETVVDMPVMKLSRQEIFALLVARNSIEQYRGTAFENPLKSIFRKLLGHLSPLDLRSMEGVNKFVTYLPNGVNTCAYGSIETLAKSCRDQVEIKVRYASASGQEERIRTLRPYHLVNHGGNWYLFAEDSEKGAIRCFHLARMSEIGSPGKEFKRTQSFSVREALAESFGIFLGDERHKVFVRLDSVAAPYAREKRWNKSQEIEERGDGSLDFRIEVSDLTEIRVWVLSWGEHAKVLSPKELVDDVKAELKKTLALY